MKPQSRGIPPSAIRRLTRYLTYVQSLCESGVEWVSSQELADTLGLTPSTVRQDLSHVDFSGVSKRGYEASGLRRVLERLLGADRSWKVAVVGAGNLGKALALHEEFARRGFVICGVFDNDERKIGKRIGRLTVQGIREMPSFVGANRIEVGVLAVPAVAAQGAADLLIASGIRGLVNLAQTHIVAPRHVAVVDSRIVQSFLELAFLLTGEARSGA